MFCVFMFRLRNVPRWARKGMNLSQPEAFRGKPQIDGAEAGQPRVGRVQPTVPAITCTLLLHELAQRAPRQTSAPSALKPSGGLDPCSCSDISAT